MYADVLTASDFTANLRLNIFSETNRPPPYQKTRYDDKCH